MDIKSLMIWDWVFHKQSDAPVRVYSLDDERGINDDSGFCDDDYSPIPLTAEILEKNGWKETQFWHEYQDGKNTIQSCLPDIRGIINGVEIQHFKCEYVHQYQHLLRLCGLDELADNFQI